MSDQNFAVKLPLEEVRVRCGTGSPSQPDLVRQICIDDIVSSQIVVVDVDHYGLDSAWEMGFAEGLGKFVVGYNSDIALKSAERLINRRSYRENFMHGWHTQTIFTNVDQLCQEYGDKTVYVCGSFANKDMQEFEAAIEGKIKKIIKPEKYVPNQQQPRYYPLQTRANAVRQVDECDVLAVVLPRYGMDAAWQIGYAAAKRKIIIGFMMKDDGRSVDRKSIWDHWMHAWREKDIFTGVPRLCAALRGYVDASIV